MSACFVVLLLYFFSLVHYFKHPCKGVVIVIYAHCFCVVIEGLFTVTTLIQFLAYILYLKFWLI